MGKREHALSLSAYKSADRERAGSLICLPGNPSLSFGKPFLLYPLFMAMPDLF